MHKKYLIFTLVLIVSGLVFVTGPVMAKSDKGQEIDINGTLPEQEGIYKIKNHPEMKLRVFIRKVRPNPNPTPTLQCNLTDADSGAVVDPAGWKLPSTWTYRLNTSSVPSSVGSSKLQTIASNAYSVWEQAINNSVTITKGQNTSVNRAKYDGQNIITWGTASGSALAVSYIWYTGGVATEVDTIMNNKFTWYWSNPNSWVTPASTTCAYQNVYDAQEILTHELGHTMGLNDEYTGDYTNNTMYGYGSKGETQKDTLTTGDIAGVKAVYNL